MTIFVLLAVGLLFLGFTGIIISLDNRKRKYKKKILRLRWRILGIVFTAISVFHFVYFAQCITAFQGEEIGERKILLRSTMSLSDVTLPSNNATLDCTLEDNIQQLVLHNLKGDPELTIVYTDALLNKKEISINDIHEIKYSANLAKKQVQIVEYFVTCKDGNFTMPGVYYYVVLSEYWENKLQQDSQ